jgi:hypothetical protein
MKYKISCYEILVDSFVVLCDELVKDDRWPTTIRHVEGNFLFIFYIKKLAKFNKKIKQNLSNLHVIFFFPQKFPNFFVEK